MTWTAEELRHWLDEVEPRIEQRDLFAWLDLTRAALPAAIQPAFHEVARTRHPDVWRAKLSAGDHDRLVRIYGRIAAAYAELRDPARCAAYAVALGRPGRTASQEAVAPPSPAAARPPGPPASTRPRGRTRPPVSSTPRPAPAPTPSASAPASPRSAPAAPPSPRRSPPSPAPTAAEPGLPIEPARAMNARALAFYRRAEGALRVGDRAAALLQLKMALASDPSSALLRAALRELMDGR